MENMLLRIHRAAGSTPRKAVETLQASVRSGLQHLAPLPILLQRLELSEADLSRLHRAVLNWGQFSTFREDLQRPFGDLQISPFEGSASDGLDLPDYAFSVLNINENNDGTITGLWQYDLRVFSKSEMKTYIGQYEEFLQRLDGTFVPSPEPEKPSGLFGGAAKPAGRSFSSKNLFGSR